MSLNVSESKVNTIIYACFFMPTTEILNCCFNFAPISSLPTSSLLTAASENFAAASNSAKTPAEQFCDVNTSDTPPVFRASSTYFLPITNLFAFLFNFSMLILLAFGFLCFPFSFFFLRLLAFHPHDKVRQASPNENRLFYHVFSHDRGKLVCLADYSRVNKMLQRDFKRCARED